MIGIAVILVIYIIILHIFLAERKQELTLRDKVIGRLESHVTFYKFWIEELTNGYSSTVRNLDNKLKLKDIQIERIIKDKNVLKNSLLKQIKEFKKIKHG